jgi:hypothetical protein
MPQQPGPSRRRTRRSKSTQPTTAARDVVRPATRPVAGSRAPSSPASVLQAAGAAFAALVTGPAPLSLDAAAVEAAGLGGGVLPMDRVRDRLLDRSVGYEVRDRVWTAVVDRARTGDPAWVIAAVGLCLPGLQRIAARLARTVPADQVPDVESELLAGFLAELKVMDTSSGRVAARLCWAAYRAADRYRRADPARAGVVVPLADSAAPPRPWGHPDFVLSAAVADGVLTQYEAELIATTRLEAVTLDQLAAAWRLPRSTLADDRARAERRLVTRLTSTGRVTTRSRSRAWPDFEAADPDSQGARTSRPSTSDAPSDQRLAPQASTGEDDTAQPAA